MKPLYRLALVLALASTSACTQAQKDAAGSDVTAGDNAGLACAKQDITSVIGEVAGAFSSGDYNSLESKLGSELFRCATKALVAVFDAVRAQVTSSPTMASAPPTKIEINARAYLAVHKIK